MRGITSSYRLGGAWYYIQTAILNLFLGAFLTLMIYLKIRFEGGEPHFYAMWILNVVFALLFSTLAVMHDRASHPVMFRQETDWWE